MNNKLTLISREMRLNILKMSYNCGNMGAHLGGSMSCVEILAVLYSKFLRMDKENPYWEERDRFIMSKAHAVMAQYAALRQIGFLSDDDLDHAMTSGSILLKHPKMNITYGIEFSGGSLGQGLSLGVGTAIALKRKGLIHSKVYVLVGDGECDEGSIWEAAALAGHRKLNNLVVIVDCNRLQNDGTTDQILDKGSLELRWKSFGFITCTVDGHSLTELEEAFSTQYQESPLAILANTVKGKGVSFAENVVEWHASTLTKQLYEQALEELS